MEDSFFLSDRTTRASRKFNEFRHKRFRYFVKYSCAQVKISETTHSETSKSYDQGK